MGIETPPSPTPFSQRTSELLHNSPPETVLEFANNRVLIDLCGQYDRHLATIEKNIGVNILRNGNRLKIIGEAEACTQGATILQELYNRLETGKGDQAAAELLETILRLRSTSAESFFPVTPDQIDFFSIDAELRTLKKPVSPRTKAQKSYVKNLFENELGFGIGPAGTGKTYLAVAVGITMFIAGGVDRIILSRPAVEAGERLGFLPGDMKDKVDPYMQPLYDALNDFIPGRQMQKLLEDKKIEVAPLAFMRGRTLSNAFVVLDEAQNATPIQMKMFLTRLGEGSRMVITGDPSQIDLPKGSSSGLVEAMRILQGVAGVSFNHFSTQDIVRHPLVARIVQAYDADASRRAPPEQGAKQGPKQG